jgi:amino acid transporter
MAIAANESVHKTKSLHQILRMRDLVPLSVSSVGPMFSVAATGGVMAADAGWWTLPAIALLALPFVISAFIFRMLNRRFPHAGASYHWSARIVGRTVGRYQAWILILAYFFSIPPIAIPASAYTLALIAPHYNAPPIVQLALALFWIVFAAVPLLLGARPMARLTQAFFFFEVFSLTTFTVVGLIELPHLAIPVHFGPPPIGGILIVAVIAATILDGWEVDSYAAEECRRPRADPGKAGIIGLFGALLFYLILYPLLLLETPISHLANAVDPLAVWSQRLVPGKPWLMLVPILCSSAGGMWLVAYTLIRAMYAMGRENLISPAFARLNRQRVPHIATIAVFGAAALVVAFQLLVSSLATFFSLVLSAAGFFLLAEFFLDSVTALVFLTVGHRRIPGLERLRPLAHRLLLAGSALSTVILGALLVAFFFYGPIGIGHGIDQIIAAMLGIGVAFTWWTRRRTTGLVAFAGHEVTDEA